MVSRLCFACALAHLAMNIYLWYHFICSGSDDIDPVYQNASWISDVNFMCVNSWVDLLLSFYICSCFCNHGRYVVFTVVVVGGDAAAAAAAAAADDDDDGGGGGGGVCYLLWHVATAFLFYHITFQGHYHPWNATSTWVVCCLAGANAMVNSWCGGIENIIIAIDDRSGAPKIMANTNQETSRCLNRYCRAIVTEDGSRLCVAGPHRGFLIFGFWTCCWLRCSHYGCPAAKETLSPHVARNCSGEELQMFQWINPRIGFCVSGGVSFIIGIRDLVVVGVWTRQSHNVAGGCPTWQ